MLYLNLRNLVLLTLFTDNPDTAKKTKIYAQWNEEDGRRCPRPKAGLATFVGIYHILSDAGASTRKFNMHAVKN